MLPSYRVLHERFFFLFPRPYSPIKDLLYQKTLLMQPVDLRIVSRQYVRGPLHVMILSPFHPPEIRVGLLVDQCTCLYQLGILLRFMDELLVTSVNRCLLHREGSPFKKVLPHAFFFFFVPMSKWV